MKEYVSNTVSELRARLNITQEELANRTDVSRQTVIAIEKGHYTPSVLLALKIARVCNKQVEEVFSISHEK